MDHKVSKDMISSGMIPSGERTQADLGRIQYGSAPSPSSLMDAYKSIYEHHQKDKDGNTIPHEDEINEMAGLAKGVTSAKRAKAAQKSMKSMAAKAAAKTAKAPPQMANGKTPAPKPTPKKPSSSVMGTVSRGLSSAASAAGRADKAIAARGGLKKMGTDYLKKNKGNIKGALLGKTAAGTATRIAGAAVVGRMSAGGDDNNRGYDGYKNMQNFHYVPDGDTLSEDLFDALKSALIEEGCDEKNVMKIMSSITPDFINETIQEENLNEIAFTTAAILAGKLAAKALAKKAVIGATKFAMKKGTTAAATKLVGKVGAKKAAAKYLPMAAKKAPGALAKSAVKNPVNTMVAGSMVMPQGGGAPAPQATQRAVTSGKRTAGMQRMDLDLFDIVKGQLLDEGLTEEECNDVMTTLTLEEINETLQLDEKMGKMGAKLGARTNPKIVGSYTEKPQVPVKKKLGGRTDGTAGSYVEKPQIAQ